MRKFIVSVVVALVVLCGASFYFYETNNASETYENKKIKNDSNMLSMMLETSAGSGEYQKTTASAWPNEDYIFNSELSKCKNGSNLKWDSKNKQVIFDGNSVDKCYVYFDKYVPTLANHIKRLYTGIQGENNLYYHNSSLTNGAEDNSYRYAGSSDTTNNFVCFGSNDDTCPTDNLYRVIGVFNNNVKLIKYDYAKTALLGSNGDYSTSYANTGFAQSTLGNNLVSDIGAYSWNYKSINTGYGVNQWDTSYFNNINLNTNYLNNIGTSWSDKIETVTWVTGGNTYENINGEISHNVYQNEIVSPVSSSTYNAKVGLMYASDYGFAAPPNVWLTILGNYLYQSIKDVNWMYMGLVEWTITRRSDYDNIAFGIGETGNVGNSYCSNIHAARPVFYLKKTIMYKSGDGTKNNPFRVE